MGKDVDRDIDLDAQAVGIGDGLPETGFVEIGGSGTVSVIEVSQGKGLCVAK